MKNKKAFRLKSLLKGIGILLLTAVLILIENSSTTKYTKVTKVPLQRMTIFLRRRLWLKTKSHPWLDTEEVYLMKIIRVFLFVSVVILSMACSISIGNQTTGSGDVITEKRSVGDFTGIDLSCSADVVIVQGKPLAVSIEGEDNILPLIETRVSGETLNIDAKSNSSFRTTRPLIVHITVPELSSIRVTGSGDVDMGEWAVGIFELETTGSGNIHIDSLETRSLTARLSGSGDISIAQGSAGSQRIKVSGSGDYNGASLQSREAEASTTGSGDITVWATDSLSASISGSGDIQYYGSPEVDKSDTGSGSVEKLGDRP
jgi:hypothetical protein